MPNKPTQLPPTTSGPIHNVPCPNCGKGNSFSGHAEMIDTGSVFTCDHCRLPMQVQAVSLVKVLHLRKPVGAVTRIKKG